MIRNIRIFGNVLTLGWTQGPDGYTAGTSNETEDNYFVPYLDYDNVYYSIVLKDLKHIQSIFNLGNFLVFQSSKTMSENGEEKGNYHCYGFDKLTFAEHFEMLRHTRCDAMAKRMGRFYPYRNWVLRFEAKFNENGDIIKASPKFKEFIPGKGWRECSNGHFLMIGNLFKVPKDITRIVQKSAKWDKSTSCDVIPYLAKVK